MQEFQQYLTRRNIIIGVIVLVVLCCGLSNILGNHTTTGTATTQHTTVVKTPGATATTKPKPSPTTETRSQRASRLAALFFHDSLWRGTSQLDNPATTYDDPTNTVVITINIKDFISITDMQNTVKGVSFDVEAGFWQSAFAAAEVDVVWTGQVVDAYGHTSTGSYGYVHLAKATAALFVWKNLDPNSAWSIYDDEAVRQN